MRSRKPTNPTRRAWGVADLQKSDPAMRDPNGQEARAMEYIATLQKALRLAHWTIALSLDDPNDLDGELYGNPRYSGEGLECAAAVDCMETRHFAVIYLGPGYYDGTPEQQRQYLTHEFAHILTAAMMHSVMDLQNACDELAWRHLCATFTRQYELSVDDLAVLLAPSLPLPPQPRRGRRQSAA